MSIATIDKAKATKMPFCSAPLLLPSMFVCPAGFASPPRRNVRRFCSADFRSLSIFSMAFASSLYWCSATWYAASSLESLSLCNVSSSRRFLVSASLSDKADLAAASSLDNFASSASRMAFSFSFCSLLFLASSSSFSMSSFSRALASESSFWHPSRSDISFLTFAVASATFLLLSALVAVFFSSALDSALSSAFCLLLSACFSVLCFSFFSSASRCSSAFCSSAALSLASLATAASSCAFLASARALAARSDASSAFFAAAASSALAFFSSSCSSFSAVLAFATSSLSLLTFVLSRS
mmetsp:Transcript_120528/g.239923  ORF Transcript_120528/g.239923 Transcript_120528/m.239923 type:complete len:298 (+) Transcript_120528:92-985(+)